METTILKVIKEGKSYSVVDIHGNNLGTNDMYHSTRKNAYDSGKALIPKTRKNGSIAWNMVAMSEYDKLVSNPPQTKMQDIQAPEVTTPKMSSSETIKSFIQTDSIKLKPNELVISDLKWKYLVRSVLRSKNIMMTGPSGTGKTLTAREVARQLGRPFYNINLGSTQDPRATLIGNTHYDKNKGTFFSESSFIKAIKTENTVILLDELSRAHPDAWNILMTALDSGQRYIRLDEADGSPVVNVANGVTFIATANIGNEYTSTRVIDRAILDRFVIIEMELLTMDEEVNLLTKLFPKLDNKSITAIAEIADHTRVQSRLDDGKVTGIISTRVTVEMAGLMLDGFNLSEASEICVLPYFSPDGGLDSERTYMKQFIQKYETDNGDDIFVNDSGYEDDSFPMF